MQSPYEAAGGHAGLPRLAETWHARVMADELVSRTASRTSSTWDVDAGTGGCATAV